MRPIKLLRKITRYFQPWKTSRSRLNGFRRNFNESTIFICRMEHHTSDTRATNKFMIKSCVIILFGEYYQCDSLSKWFIFFVCVQSTHSVSKCCGMPNCLYTWKRISHIFQMPNIFLLSLTCNVFSSLCFLPYLFLSFSPSFSHSHTIWIGTPFSSDFISNHLSAFNFWLSSTNLLEWFPLGIVEKTLLNSTMSPMVLQHEMANWDNQCNDKIDDTIFLSLSTRLSNSMGYDGEQVIESDLRWKLKIPRNWISL